MEDNKESLGTSSSGEVSINENKDIKNDFSNSLEHDETLSKKTSDVQETSKIDNTNTLKIPTICYLKDMNFIKINV